MGPFPLKEKSENISEESVIITVVLSSLYFLNCTVDNEV
jgi:hypothetical protein